MRVGRSDAWIVAIGVFKLAKASLLVAGGLVLLVRGEPLKLAQHFGTLSHQQIGWAAAASFAYAGVFLVEGAGLIARKRWAEWLTVVVTASFIPLEIWHLVHHTSWTRGAVLAGNVAILVYLLWRRLSEL
jgi:uncharacterized membrane protein (DUF2068 family)